VSAAAAGRFGGWWAGVLGAALTACTFGESVGAQRCPGGRGTPLSDGGCGTDAAAPIGEPRYPDFDETAFTQVARGISGTWLGAWSGLGRTGDPFELIFDPESGASGHFELRCLQGRSCPPFGASKDGGSGGGEYRLIYVDSHGVGQGELSWRTALAGASVEQSVTFRNLLLQGDGTTLAFLIDTVVGPIEIVAARLLLDAGHGLGTDGAGAAAGDERAAESGAQAPAEAGNPGGP
jgi:hypothetical protein